MPRYFLEVAYKGTNYSGFQIQQNANTIQAEIEKAMNVLMRLPSPRGEGLGVRLFVSSRTDAGVHALQNFFHFDADIKFQQEQLYNLNALLPPDIVVKNIYAVHQNAHCRFDAIAREYKYYIYQKKNPFLFDIAFYYPYKINIGLLQQVAEIIMNYKDFSSFSKRHTKTKNFECNIIKSIWMKEENCFVYNVIANRFLRGMVKGLVGTMLKVGREIISVKEFQQIIENRDCIKADFSPASKGLFLVSVKYADNLLKCIL
ncbi:MAG: tRNA pseudouridine(38-40) synthase TruA [Chitinophagaceae bacterium]